MNAKKYVSLNSLEKELSSLHVLLRRNRSVSRSFDFSKIRNVSFFDYWASYYRENWYDFQLYDFSLLSFIENKSGGETFLYIGCPVQCDISEDEYYSTKEYDIIGDVYEDYILTCPKVDNIPYLRYDNAQNQYSTGLHPASHFHFGYNQKNRVGCFYYVDIVSFVAIVLRQYYPDSWRKVLNAPTIYSALCAYKDNLIEIGDQYYKNNDISHDMYLK